MKLDAKRRSAVKEAIEEYCEHKKLTLYALHVRTNHAHLVISAGAAADKLMGWIKAYATRRLRATGLVSEEDKVWSRHGSTKYLWTDDHIFAACEYVNNGQGRELPDFD